MEGERGEECESLRAGNGGESEGERERSGQREAWTVCIEIEPGGKVSQTILSATLIRIKMINIKEVSGPRGRERRFMPTLLRPAKGGRLRLSIADRRGPVPGVCFWATDGGTAQHGQANTSRLLAT